MKPRINLPGSDKEPKDEPSDCIVENDCGL